MKAKKTHTKTTTQPQTMAEPEMILVERRDGVGLITLNRPKQLNALNSQLARETLAALKEFDSDPKIRHSYYRKFQSLCCWSRH